MEKCSAVRKENAVKKRRILEDFARILERKKTPQFRKTAVLRHKNVSMLQKRYPAKKDIVTIKMRSKGNA